MFDNLTPGQALVALTITIVVGVTVANYFSTLIFNKLMSEEDPKPPSYNPEEDDNNHGW